MKTKLTNLRLRIDGLIYMVDKLLNPPPIVLKKTREMSEEEVEAWKSHMRMSFIPAEPMELQSFDPRDELKDCKKSLMLSKARIGKMLGCLGEPTPYQNDGKRKSIEDIEPVADKHRPFGNHMVKIGVINAGTPKEKPNFVNWETLNYIQKIDWLRQDISECVNIVNSLDFFNELNNKLCKDERTSQYAFLHHCEVLVQLDNARFFLGFELGKIKEEDNRKKADLKSRYDYYCEVYDEGRFTKNEIETNATCDGVPLTPVRASFELFCEMIDKYSYATKLGGIYHEISRAEFCVFPNDIDYTLGDKKK